MYMEKLFSKLGITFYSVGSPPTETVARSNRTIIWLLFAATLCFSLVQLVAVFIASRYLDESAKEVLTTISGITFAACVMPMMALFMTQIDQLTSMATISDNYCPTLAGWVDEYPEVRMHVGVINDQGRALMMGDWVFLSAWVEKREEEARLVKRHAACLSLHGVGAK